MLIIKHHAKCNEDQSIKRWYLELILRSKLVSIYYWKHNIKDFDQSLKIEIKTRLLTISIYNANIIYLQII